MRTHAFPDVVASRRRHIVSQAILLAAMGIVAAPVHADYEFCVGSIADLDAAIDQASLPVGQSTVIKVRQGNYDITQSKLLNGLGVLNTFQLLGGYDTADCSTRTLNPANTVFFEATGSANFNGNLVQGDALIEGITFRDLGYDWNQAGLALYVADDPGFSITLRNNIFQNTFVQIGIANDMPGKALVENNLIYESVAKASTGFSWGADTQGYPGGVVANLTMINNTISNFEYGIVIAAAGSDALYNNIVWNSLDTDILTYGVDGNPRALLMVDNTYSTLTGNEQSGSSGSSSADPQFIDAGTGNFHLPASSPAVNSGDNDVPIGLAGTDLDNKPRVIGSSVDRGPYEASVDDTIPQILTVANANGSGAGSLYQAIVDANANPDFNYIQFAIPGTCPVTISSTLADLPTLTSGAKIDGFTQPGSTPNTATIGDNATRCIILDSGGVADNGLVFRGASTSHVWVQGLAFSGYPGAALELAGGTNDIVLGNQFGGKVGGVTLAANDTDIKLTQFARNALIGFDTPAFRNVIAGATNYGISIGAIGSSSTGHIISGNLFGIYGSNAFVGSDGNRSALNITTGNNTLMNNVFANNFYAVDVTGINAQGNTIQNNAIGRIPQVCFVLLGVQHCLPDAAPNISGITIESGAHDNVVQGNTVWNNTDNGIAVADAGQGNLLSGNSIFNNGCCTEGNTFGGIYLYGTTEGDYDGAAGATSLPNRGQNAPAIARAYGGSSHGWMEGSLGSTNGIYSIEVFASQPRSGSYGEGDIFVGSGAAAITHAPVGANGHANFRYGIANPGTTLTTGLKITATATDGLNNTSQFSAPVDYLCDVIFANAFDDTETNACPLP